MNAVTDYRLEPTAAISGPANPPGPWHGFPIELRDYQLDGCLNRLRTSRAAGKRRPLVCAPTGAGKGVVAVALAWLMYRGGIPILLLVHRRELMRQYLALLETVGIEAGVIAAGFPRHPDRRVQIALVQTACRRNLPTFGVVIIDECHHVVRTSYRTVIQGQPNAWIIGLTATPARLDGRGLGIEAGGSFDDLIVVTDTRTLIDQQWLSPYRLFVAQRRLDLRHVRVERGDYVPQQLHEAVRRAGLMGNAIKGYCEHAEHQPALVYCINIAHTEATAEAFRAAGYSAAATHGGLPLIERDRRLAALAGGDLEILVSCEILGEGIDVPAVGCIILLRPTKSLIVFLQQIGRGMRAAPGKKHLVVIDIAGNSVEHGLPCEHRNWALGGVARQPASKAPFWECQECGCANRLGASACEACGAQRLRHDRSLLVDEFTALVEVKALEATDLGAEYRLDRELREARNNFTRFQRLLEFTDPVDWVVKRRSGMARARELYWNDAHLLKAACLRATELHKAQRSDGELVAYVVGHGNKPGQIHYLRRDHDAIWGPMPPPVAPTSAAVTQPQHSPQP